jgi:hypothetical protein
VSIRIDIGFAAPITADERVSLLLALAALPEVRRAVVSPDRRLATVYAGEMPLERVRGALAECGLAPQRIGSGLAPEAEVALGSPAGERFRPIGR